MRLAGGQKFAYLGDQSRFNFEVQTFIMLKYYLLLERHWLL